MRTVSYEVSTHKTSSAWNAQLCWKQNWMTSAKIHRVCKGTLQTRWPDCQQMCHDASRSPPCPICNPEQMRGAGPGGGAVITSSVTYHNWPVQCSYNTVTEQLYTQYTQSVLKTAKMGIYTLWASVRLSKVYNHWILCQLVPRLIEYIAQHIQYVWL